MEKEFDVMKEQIGAIISDFIANDFQKNPRDFFSEADVRAVLYTRLKDKVIKRRIFPFEKLKKQQNGNGINTDLFKCEYSYEESRINEDGTRNTSATKFDIAGLHEDENIWVKMEVWEDHYKREREEQMYWNQPVRFGIEIKSAWHTRAIIRGIDGVLKDRNKLRKYQTNKYGEQFPFDGVALLFVSDSDEKPLDTIDPRVHKLDQAPFSSWLSSIPEAYCITSAENENRFGLYKIS